MAFVGRLSSECHHLWTADSSPPLLTHVRYALADFKKYNLKSQEPIKTKQRSTVLLCKMLPRYSLVHVMPSTGNNDEPIFGQSPITSGPSTVCGTGTV